MSINSELDPLDPHVSGFMFDNGVQGIYVPLVVSEDPGKGHVGAFLDALPKDRRVVFSTVVNAVLAGMLTRRGFIPTQEEHEGEVYDVYERMASNSET
jgi:hypothetical protein